MRIEPNTKRTVLLEVWYEVESFINVFHRYALLEAERGLLWFAHHASLSCVRRWQRGNMLCAVVHFKGFNSEKNLASSGRGISFIKCIWEAFHNVPSHERCKPAPWVEREPVENSWAIKWIILSRHSADENMPNPKSLILKNRCQHAYRMGNLPV